LVEGVEIFREYGQQGLYFDGLEFTYGPERTERVRREDVEDGDGEEAEGEEENEEEKEKEEEEETEEGNEKIEEIPAKVKSRSESS
jgi:hypothetical protein